MATGISEAAGEWRRRGNGGPRGWERAICPLGTGASVEGSKDFSNCPQALFLFSAVLKN